MKKLLFPLALASVTFASNASAVDMGLGASLSDGDETTLIVPLEINEDIRVEPFLSRVDSDTTTGNTSTEVVSTGLGAGVFFKMPTGQATKLYAGGRVSFDMSETTTSNGVTSTNTEATTVGIIPTAGLEYALNPKFTVAGEVGLAYSTTIDGDRTSCGPGGCTTVDYDVDSLSTVSRVVLRWFY